MPSKTDKHQYFFEVSLNWLEGRIGVASVNEVKESIKVSTPSAFAGGIAGYWSPEQLFLSSLSTGLMTTFLAIAEKRKLPLVNFTCSAIGQVQLVGAHLEFTNINLFPKIFVQKESEIPIANEVLMKTYKYCIIANSIKAHLIHHGEVLLESAVKIN